MRRGRVSKGRSARKFRDQVKRVRMPNVTAVFRGGIRL